MFWSVIERQMGLFGEDKYSSSETIARLIAFAKLHFPDENQNFHRRVAFLSHRASIQFLAPMLKGKFGDLDSAKVPTLEWLELAGCFETYARSTRESLPTAKPVNARPKSMPKWYLDYLKTSRSLEMKSRSESWHRSFMGELACSVNARHPYEVLHHRDYGAIGCADEFRYLTPLCHACHFSINARGPRPPAVMPQGVGKWL